jgi:hypothetical protein
MIGRTFGIVLGVVLAAIAGCQSTDARALAAGPSLLELAPGSGPVGTRVTVRGAGFAAKENTVTFGPGYVKDLPSADGRMIQFVVPEGLDLCAPGSPGPCAMAYPRVVPGNYDITVITGGLASNRLIFTVTER